MFNPGCKAISKICKGPPVFFRVVYNSSKRAQIFLSRQLSCNFKLPCNSLALGNVYHFVSELFKDLAVYVCVSFGKIATCYYRSAKSKMVGLRGMRSRNADNLSEAFTTGELAKHHNQQLIPAAERFNVFISLISHYYSLKCFLRKKFNELSKNVFPAVHCLIFLLFPKVKIQIVDKLFLLYFASIMTVTRFK